MSLTQSIPSKSTPRNEDDSIRIRPARKRPARLQPGVILIQIDGLPINQFKRAIKAGRLPFLAKLLRRGSHSLKTFYPGQPSCTPAVQAEIMFGKRCAVPAFSFFDKELKKEFRMYEANWAKRIAEDAREGAAPLLEGGSSYGNIYAGGALRAGYCGELNTPQHWKKELSLFRLAKLTARFPLEALRVVKLCLVELGLSFYDLFKGGLSRGEFFTELQFIAARVGVSIALREAIRYRVRTDAVDGLPIIHANFFGYDEQAHRRGPHSRFAHWSLKGIDGAIRSLYRKARRSGGRDYDIIIFSDHGQEAVIPFTEVAGRSLDDETESLFASDIFQVSRSDPFSAIAERARHLFESEPEGDSENGSSKRMIRVKYMGPVAHVYIDEGLTDEEKELWARRYVEESEVPVTLYLSEAGQARCAIRGESGGLEVLERLFEVRKHPFTKEVLEDLSLLVESRLSGDLILLGWRAGAKPISFSAERGAHGGPGVEETQGFAMLPKRIDVAKSWIRGLDLREIAFRLSGRPPESRHVKIGAQVAAPPRGVRIATYNVHGGVGTDRRFDADRIAHVVERMDADIVCFQEAFRPENDVNSLEIALREEFENSYHFHFLPLHSKRGWEYGLAIASRLPIEILKSEPFALPHSAGGRDRREPRGAIWARIGSGERSFEVVNTHLGLRSLERAQQVSRLLSDDWLGNGVQARRAIMGDLNAGPGSVEMVRLCNHYVDAQAQAEGRFPGATFVSWAPVRRIDHALLSPDCRIERVSVYDSRLTRLASDHLPLFVDVEFDRFGVGGRA